MMQLSAKHPTMEMRNPVQRIGGGGIEQIPADWNQTDETAVDYIKNKPDLSGFVDTEDLAEVAFSGDYEDLINTPTVEKVNYNLSFSRLSGGNGVFTIDNPKETEAEMIEDFRSGKAKFNRPLNLTYDPIDALLKEGTVLPDYELVADITTNSAGTGHMVVYRRYVGFTLTQTQQYVDNLFIQCNISTNKITNITQNYVQMFDAIILVSDNTWNTDPYPHAITFNNSGGLWGKTNLATLKTSRAGYASQFNFKLRVQTHGDNVWLYPLETTSNVSLPVFVGESENLGKKIIVSFDNFTDNAHPTGTIDMEDLPHKQVQADWNQTDETALDYIKNKPVEPEITTYDISFMGQMLTMYGKFQFVNTEDSHETIFEKLMNGTAQINRIFDLTYDPINSLPNATVDFPDYELDGVAETSTGYNLFYKRVMSFSPAQYTNPLLDVLTVSYKTETNTFSNIYHNYKPINPSIIIYTDFEFADQPYPHAIKFSNAGGRWGKTNLASVKNVRAGFSSDFNFLLRVTTHGDNVWLRPTETVSANALPRFIGESEKLRKRVVVTFDNWTDDDNPTATMDLQDLVDDTRINSLIDTKLGVVENGTY